MYLFFVLIDLFKNPSFEKQTTRRGLLSATKTRAIQQLNLSKLSRVAPFIPPNSQLDSLPRPRPMAGKYADYLGHAMKTSGLPLAGREPASVLDIWRIYKRSLQLAMIGT